jgi:copper ion binding protein
VVERKKALREESTMATTTYTVSGMTCAHCVNSVSTEVGGLAGVSDVRVDLASGQVTVTSEEPLDIEAVRGAVEEAGYDLVGSGQ